MKNTRGTKQALLALLVVLVMLLAACGGSGTNSTTVPKGTEKADNLTFVVVDDSNWDKEVTIGQYKYTLAVTLLEDGKLELVGTCTGRPEAQSGNQGGPQGSGSNDADAQTTAPQETLAPMTQAEMDAQKFIQSGTWVYEAGYGYTITIGDYTTKTDYEKASARQYFYGEIQVNGEPSGLLQFMAKDSAFRKEIASDYAIFEIRDAELIFEVTDTNTGNNPNSTHLYLEKDGSANSLTYQGSTGTYKRGTWRKNSDNSITVSIGGTDYSCDYCDIPGKEGYRITYNSDTMYSNNAVTYSDEDFNGKTLTTLLCAEGDYTLELTEKGFAVLYKNGELQHTGKYTEENGTYTLTIDGDTFVSDGDTITIEYAASSGNSSSGGGEADVRTFNLDGTAPAPAGEGDQPEGTQPEGGSQGGEGGES